MLGMALLAACASPTSQPGKASRADEATVSAPSSAYVPPPAAIDGTVPRETVLSATASVFPMDRYDQDVDRWIAPSRADYRVALLPADQQQRAMQSLLATYFGAQDGPVSTSGDARATTSTRSPWDAAFVADTVNPLGRIALAARIEARLRTFSPDGPREGFGANLRPHPASWIGAIRANIDLPSILLGKDGDATAASDGDGITIRNGQAHRDERPGDRIASDSDDRASGGYRPARRAISVVQAAIRLLPTDDPYFYDPRLPGEGYPFDNLQDSAIAPGTPLYVVALTRDRAWAYVMSPGLGGWVHTTAIGMVDDRFVSRWRQAAYARLLAVTARDVTLRDGNGVFRFHAPVGTVLPAGPTPGTVLAPAVDINRHAVIVTARAPELQWQPMPLSPTPQNMARLMKALQGRPYGWGGSGFYNDCSLELLDMMMPFGLLLPRHSSFQVEGPGMVDLSNRSEDARLRFLMKHGRPFFTIIHITGHVMLYLGNGIVDGKQVALVYEDMWGLAPADRSRRAIVGQSAIMPLLSSFPEDPALQGQAGGKIFRLGFHAQGLGPLPLAAQDDIQRRDHTPASTSDGADDARPVTTPDPDASENVTPDMARDGH